MTAQDMQNDALDKLAVRRLTAEVRGSGARTALTSARQAEADGDVSGSQSARPAHRRSIGGADHPTPRA